MHLGLDPNAKPGTYPAGAGTVIYDDSSPAALSYKARGADHVRALTLAACRSAGLAYSETNFLALRRGPYVVAAGLDESLSDAPRRLTGRFIDLFDAGLPLVESVTLTPGRRCLLLDLDRVWGRPRILAAACKTRGPRRLPGGGFRFHAAGPDKTEAAVRLRLARAPVSVTLDGRALPSKAWTWDRASHTLLLRFPNRASGWWVTVT